MRKRFAIALVLVASTLGHAHVGSPDVYYEGDAGPYHLFVTVRMPAVIPGAAEIEVRSRSTEVQTIQVMLLHLTGPGSTFPPSPETAQRSKDDPQFFVSTLWFLELGALQVRIQADGTKGRAELSVPVASFARQSLSMSRGLHRVLVFLFLFLTLGVVPIVGAIVRESGVPPDETPQRSNRRRSWIAMTIVLIVALTVLCLNRAWWEAEAATYEHNVRLAKPPQVETELLSGNRLLIRPTSPLLAPITGGEDREVKMSDLIPDHGHLMHLFLLAVPGMNVMWHLHPERLDNGTFIQLLPRLPAGQYGLFADIVDKTGYPWTMVGTLTLPAVSGTGPAGDDSGWFGPPLNNPLSNTKAVPLPHGGRMVWERGSAPPKANVPTSFKFRVEEKDGSLARDLEPYMGMTAHAEVVSSDLSVFAHIHPAGSVPMAALDLAKTGLMTQDPADGSGMPTMGSHSTLPQPNFSFAYGFPHPGRYRIFVQIKRSREVQTAVFDASVE